MEPLSMEKFGASKICFAGNAPAEKVYGCFLKCWYPTTMGFPTKNDHFGVFWGYHHFRKHPYGWGDEATIFCSPRFFRNLAEKEGISPCDDLNASFFFVADWLVFFVKLETESNRSLILRVFFQLGEIWCNWKGLDGDTQKLPVFAEKVVGKGKSCPLHTGDEIEVLPKNRRVFLCWGILSKVNWYIYYIYV